MKRTAKPSANEESFFNRSEEFGQRHIGPSNAVVDEMLDFIDYPSLDRLIDDTLPSAIRIDEPLQLGPGRSEDQALAELKAIAATNQPSRSMIGMGYSGTITPPVILRNILENPLWYTPYTPYQAEIAQGRLEALLNFQTMVSELTALPLANASLLDEATAAAEAMAMCQAICRKKNSSFFVADDCHPQTINVVRTRASSMGISLKVGALAELDPKSEGLGGVLVQYPTTFGEIVDYRELADALHDSGSLLVVAADLLSLILLRPPGEFGADIALGSTQRFGVPMGFGGPHAAYLATHEKHARKLPGRLVGVTVDAKGRRAYRLAIQTREQHIRRDKATSNICTSQVLLAIAAGMYGLYHGPQGLERIARRVHRSTATLAVGLRQLGHMIEFENFFDTLSVKVQGSAVDNVIEEAAERGIDLRRIDDQRIGVSMDETTDEKDLQDVLECFATDQSSPSLSIVDQDAFSPDLSRNSEALDHPIFSSYHSEHEILRYITRLQSKDISLANSMIPLGSCTMKLNAAAEMLPITWPEFSDVHPYAPRSRWAGYATMIDQLDTWLREITGFNAISMQPNAGSQGEYAGLLAIRRYHQSRGDRNRDLCLIPTSAHGTNPASAVIAGFRVLAVACRNNGDIDVDDLRAKAEKHRDELAALMITYPSTHGVFEDSVIEVCDIVHTNGGQVYMDGANMNAQVGLCRPADMGADVCHLNLHKTFCIPHGGGGPGMGPIGVAKHLCDFIPGDPVSGEQPVSAANFGSPMILPISWMYIAMMGGPGLLRATQVAILNANYMAERLKSHYDILYTGNSGRVAHEFIVDCRGFEKSADITVEDIAKRLIDFGFHAPTMSWPVAGTLMIEATESESKAELDRFCDALLAIRGEITEVEEGKLDRKDNPLKNAPHDPETLSANEWSHPYSRERAAFPVSWLRERKFWPSVARIDNVYGDRNLVCACPPIDS